VSSAPDPFDVPERRPSAQAWGVVLVVDACLIAATGLVFVVL